MPDDLLGFGKVAEYAVSPLTQLITGLAKPYQMRGVADAERYVETQKADADAYRLIQLKKAEAFANEQVQEIAYRAEMRQFECEVQRQANIESIAKGAAKVLRENKEITPEKHVERDWVDQFRESCKNISDKEMQTLWSRVLAGEIENPGAFSPRTLDFLRTIRKQEAEMFVSCAAQRYELRQMVSVLSPNFS